MPGARGEKETARVAGFYLLILAVLISDQLTKLWAVSFLSPPDSLPVIPGIIHLTLVYNTGIAFGFFRSHPNLLLLLITLSLAFLFFWGWQARSRKKSLDWGLGLILGGALGNWIDRVRFGAVIDFLDFQIWPVFNLADSAITIGVFFYVAAFFRKPVT